MIKRISQFLSSLFVGILTLVALTQPAQALVAGGAASLTLSPNSVSGTTGQTFTVDVMLNTGGQAISGVALRINYPVASPLDLEVISVTPNSSLGWTFPVSQTSVGSGNMNIDLMGLTSSPTGYTSSGAVSIATITLRPVSAFSAKQMSFDAANSQVLRKSDAADILGSVGTASITASGTSVTPQTSPEPSPTTTTPEPTPTTQSTTPPSNSGLVDNTGDGSDTSGGSEDIVDVSESDPDLAAFLTSDGAGTTFGDTGTTETTTTDTGTTTNRTGVTTTSQPQPVSGAIQTTLAIVGTGAVLLLGAGYLWWKRRKSQDGDNRPPQQPPMSGGANGGSGGGMSASASANSPQMQATPTPQPPVAGFGSTPPTQQPPAPPAI